MSINTTKICDDLEIADEGTTVIAYNKNNEKVIVPYGVLEWRKIRLLSVRKSVFHQFECS